MPTVLLLKVQLTTGVRATTLAIVTVTTPGARPAAPAAIGRPGQRLPWGLGRHGRFLSASGHERRQAVAPLGHDLRLEMSPTLFPLFPFRFQITENLFKIIKSMENGIKLGKIQNKFP
jgi:hypothetical protein